MFAGFREGNWYFLTTTHPFPWGLSCFTWKSALGSQEIPHLETINFRGMVSSMPSRSFFAGVFQNMVCNCALVIWNVGILREKHDVYMQISSMYTMNLLFHCFYCSRCWSLSYIGVIMLCRHGGQHPTQTRYLKWDPKHGGLSSMTSPFSKLWLSGSLRKFWAAKMMC